MFNNRSLILHAHMSLLSFPFLSFPVHVRTHACLYGCEQLCQRVDGGSRLARTRRRHRKHLWSMVGCFPVAGSFEDVSSKSPMALLPRPLPPVMLYQQDGFSAAHHRGSRQLIHLQFANSAFVTSNPSTNPHNSPFTCPHAGRAQNPSSPPCSPALTPMPSLTRANSMEWWACLGPSQP